MEKRGEEEGEGERGKGMCKRVCTSTVKKPQDSSSSRFVAFEYFGGGGVKGR